MDKRKEAHLRMASLMFSVELTLECISQVEPLAIYRQGVKAACNNLKKQLLPDLDRGYFDLYQQDPDLVMGISNKLKELAEQIGSLQIGQMCAVSEAIPEIIKQDNNVKLKKLSA